MSFEAGTNPQNKVLELRALIKRAEERDDEESAVRYEKELRRVEQGIETDNSESNSREEIDHKLYVFRNADGMADFETLNILRDINEKMEEAFKAYIGVMPVGSHTTGNVQKTSDLDLCFILDQSVKDYGSCKRYIRSADFKAGVKDVYNKDIEPLTVDVSMESLEKAFTVDVYNESNNNDGDYLALCIGLVVGERFAQYRNRAKELFLSLPNIVRQSVLASTLAKIMQFEYHSLHKIKARNNFDEQEYYRERKRLWTNRVKRLGFIV